MHRHRVSVTPNSSIFLRSSAGIAGLESIEGYQPQIREYLLLHGSEEVREGVTGLASHVDCIACIVNKAEALANKYIDDKEQKYGFMHKVLNAILDTEYDRSSPIIDAKMIRLIKEELGEEDIWKEEKRFFNDKLLAMEGDLEKLSEVSSNRLFDSLKLALSGNIIDFSALPNVDVELVKAIVHRTIRTELDEQLFSRLMAELRTAKRLLYLADNTGEIVLDKIFIKEIRRQYPHLEILFSTRGKPIFNDATEADAYYVGVDQYAVVMNNGTDLPGNDLLEVSDEFRRAFDSADVIIAKGQGNFESLFGCGRNVYYLFLCKCEMMIQKLSSGRFDSMFIGEK